jgi:cytosine deaminase
MFDVVLNNVRLTPVKDGPTTDIGIKDGRIAAVETGLQGAVSVDEGGRFANGGFMESHLHLEKAFLLDSMPRDAHTLADAIDITGEMKRGFTCEDMAKRARKVLDREIAFGTTAVRAHVEVDDTLQLKAMQTVLRLREEYRDRLRLQVAVFPQEGIFRQTNVKQFMHASLEMGADVVGGIPYNDPDPAEHLDFVFALAEEFHKPVDVHIDLSDNPEQLDILSLADHAIAHGMQGSVSAGHMTSLGSVPLDKAARIADRIAEAGISVVCLPMTDVYLNGRDDLQAPRRGITPVRLLQQHGVNVVVATNNIQNAFTPFGNGDPLNAANMLAEMAHFGSAEQQHDVMDMLTVNAAKANHMGSGAIEKGQSANIVVFDTRNERDVLLEHAPVWMSFYEGKRVN